MATIATIEILRIHTNQLSTLPVLYHLPLIHVADNPLFCNKSLWWMRKWSWVKPPLAVDDMTCHLPTGLGEQALVDVRPTKLDYHKGMGFFILLTHTNISCTTEAMFGTVGLGPKTRDNNGNLGFNGELMDTDNLASHKSLGHTTKPLYYLHNWHFYTCNTS